MSISKSLPKPVMPLNILIVGAGVCGPALAFLLVKSNPKHTITVIERFPSLRTGGQQIDLKEEGISVVRKMGLLGALKDICIYETGMELVDTNGKTVMKFGINDPDKKRGLNLTNEYEFMRGDMVQVFHDASIEERRKAENAGEKEGALRYKFGTTITALEQTEEKATVTFSDGQKKQYDLVVAADGQSSRTRRLAFGEEVSSEAFRPIGMQAAYYSIPRLEHEDNMARIFFGPGNTMVMKRTGNRPMTQVYFFLMKNKERDERIRKTYKQPLEIQKAEWKDICKDAGWESQRLTEDLENVENFYACEIVQVKMPQLHTGRVVLLGDSGYCPSAFTGYGTTLSLIGAYVLAGELAKNDQDMKAAIQKYSEDLQAPIKELQQLPPRIGNGIYPSSQLGINITNTFLWTLSCLKVDNLLRWVFDLLPASKGGYCIPEYPELNLAE